MGELDELVTFSVASEGWWQFMLSPCDAARGAMADKGPCHRLA